MIGMLAPVKVEEELLSLPEAATELGVSHTQFWRLVQAEKIAVLRVGVTPGRKVVYGVRRVALDALKAQRAASPPHPGPRKQTCSGRPRRPRAP